MGHFLPCPGGAGLPEDSAIVAIEAENGAFVFSRDGLGDEDPLVPNDRRGIAAVGQVSAPLYIFCLGPMGWQIFFGGDSLSEWAAPERPILRMRRERRKKQQNEDGSFHACGLIGAHFCAGNKV